MKYITYSDMAATIRRNIWKVPYDVDLIVGIPRSGMIAALMIAELTNRRVADIDTFIAGHTMDNGGRGKNIPNNPIKKVLVVDDTVYAGSAISKARKKLSPLSSQYTIIYGCVFAEGEHSRNLVDMFFEYNYDPKETLYLYEWNIMSHYEHKAQLIMFDLDGVLCKEPPSDKDTKAYEEYLPNAIPMIVPATKIGGICTYRLEKYRQVTEQWLERYNIRYGSLKMINATYEERRKINSSSYKAEWYARSEWAQLFIESDPFQAPVIGRLSKKPVYCYDNNIMYQYKL